MRIAVLNNYDLSRGYGHVLEGRTPAHLLYGIDALREAGHTVDIMPFEGGRILSAIDRITRVLRLTHFIGSLRQQIPLLREIDRYDAIYAPCESQTALLAMLRRRRLLRAPLIVLAHHPPPANRWVRPFNRLLVNGADAWPSISPGSAAAWRALSDNPDKCSFIPWGADTKFYPEYTPPGARLLVYGRVNRDTALPIRAVNDLSIPATLLSTDPKACALWRARVPGALIVEYDAAHWTFLDMLPHLQDAQVVAIPLLHRPYLNGLTSLLDAMAMGRAVIMTRNPYVFPDIEQEGIGLWTRPGNEQDWINAVHHMYDNPNAARDMGLRARAYILDKLNAPQFARRIIDLITAVVPSVRAEGPGGGRPGTTS